MTTIVIADDSRGIIDALSYLIEKYGQEFSVIGEALNGNNAVELCSQLVPEIVIMDIVMPGLNGIQAIKKLVRAYPTIKVLIVSGYTDEYTLVEAFEVGACGFLSKPFSTDCFWVALRAVAAGRLFVDSISGPVLTKLEWWATKYGKRKVESC